MKHIVSFILVVCILGCQEEQVTAPPVLLGAPAVQIVDATHNAGNRHFSFLPPLVPQPIVDGTFDATLSPVVEICALQDSRCLQTLATFTMTAGPGSQTVRVAPEDEHYIVDWHTGQFAVDTETDYRIRVLVGANELGHADVDLVKTGKELKDIDPSEFVGVIKGRTVPIKFRIEEGALFVMTPNGGLIEVANGAVVLDFPAGAVSAPLTVSVEPGTIVAGSGAIEGTLFALGPDGTEFAEPVGVTILYDEAMLPAGLSEEDLVMLHEHSDGRWEELESTVDIGANTVTAFTSGFSTFALGPPTLTIEVTPTNATLQKCATIQLTAVARYGTEEFPLRFAFWESSDETIATIDAFGNVQALTPGTATMTARITDVEGSAEITVEPNPSVASCDMVVSINATAVDVPNLTLSGVGTFPSAVAQAFELAPGTYTLGYGPSVEFQITATGEVDFDPSLDAILSGRGSSTLTVTGHSIDIDVSDLSYQSVTFSFGGPFTGDVFSLRLLPGLHSVGVGTFYAFAITDAGTVDFDPALDGIFSGRGTSILTVTGHSVTIDVSDLSYQSVTVSSTASFTDDVFSLRLLPGRHSVGVGTFYAFAITDAGTVDFDPALDGIFSGRGGTTLTVTGFPVVIDVSDLSYIFVTVSNVALFHEDVISIHLTPGPHSVQGGSFHRFTITEDGKFDFDPTLDAIFSGRGSSALTVTGFDITIDATQQAFANFDIAAVGTFSAATPQVVSLTYGTHSFISTGLNFSFTIEQPGGTVDYAPSLDSQVSGRGTHVMTLFDPSLDTDGDGVPDGIDNCSDTLPSVPVGPDGCPDLIGTYVGTLRYRTFVGDPLYDITFQGFTLVVDFAPIDTNGEQFANGRTSFPAGTPQFLLNTPGLGNNCLPLGDGMNGFTGNVSQETASLGRCGNDRWTCGDGNNRQMHFVLGRIFGGVCIVGDPGNHGRFDFDVTRQ